MNQVRIAELWIGLEHIREGTIVLARNAPERVTFLGAVLDDVVVGGIGSDRPVLGRRCAVNAAVLSASVVNARCLRPSRALQAVRPRLSVARFLFLRRPLRAGGERPVDDLRHCSIRQLLTIVAACRT